MPTYTAPNPVLNQTITAAQRTVRQLAAAGFPGAVLFINPVAPAGVNAGQLIPVSQFDDLGIPSFQPVYFQLQVPGKPYYYDAGLVSLDLDAGVPATQALQ